MRRLSIAATLLFVACVTDADRRRNQIEVGERLIARLQPTDPQIAELKFQLAYLRFEEATDATDGGLEKNGLLKASAELGAILRDYPTYARSAEVLEARAEAPSQLEFWSDAEAAWRRVAKDSGWRRYRLGQALARLRRCDEALVELPPVREPRVMAVRCECDPTTCAEAKKNE